MLLTRGLEPLIHEAFSHKYTRPYQPGACILLPLPVSVSEYTLTVPSKEAVARIAGSFGAHRASKFQLLPEGKSHMISAVIGFQLCNDAL